MTDDTALIHALKSHHPESWAEFFRLHHLAVWRFVLRRVRCRQTADDITAESFMAALQAIDQYNPQAGSIQRWLYGIVRYKLADHLRQHYREVKHLTFTSDTSWQNTAVMPQPPADLQVDAILESLPVAERDVLIWKYQDQISVHEMAARLNRTEKAVENLLYRARERFKSLYPPSLKESQNTYATQSAGHSE